MFVVKESSEVPLKFLIFLMYALHLFMLWQEAKASSEILSPVPLKLMVASENEDYLYF